MTIYGGDWGQTTGGFLFKNKRKRVEASRRLHGESQAAMHGLHSVKMRLTAWVPMQLKTKGMHA
jgi:hypothetical protein